MDPRTLGRGIAAGRVLFGTAILLAPKLVLSTMTDGDAAGPLVWMSRAFGIRDIVLGAGALMELAQVEPEGRWVAFGAAADSADAVAAVVWRDELGTGGTLATLSLAVPAAIGGWVSAAGLHR